MRDEGKGKRNGMENLELTVTTSKRKSLVKYAHLQDGVDINYPGFCN